MANIQPTTGLLGSMRKQSLAWSSILGEFIDNAFDADARRILITFNKKRLEIQDDGSGCKNLLLMLTPGAREQKSTTRLGCYGTGAAAKLVTWSLMGVAQGIAGVPSATAPAEQLAGIPVTIAGTNGVHKISFSGPWGVDFDAYVCYDPAGAAPTARLASYGHGNAESGEAAEFLAANGVPFEERMQVLRLRSTANEFQLVIVPYMFGTTPAVTVYRRPDGVLVAAAVATIETPV